MLVGIQLLQMYVTVCHFNFRVHFSDIKNGSQRGFRVTLCKILSVNTAASSWQPFAISFRPLWNHMKCRRGPRILTPGDQKILDDPMFTHLVPPDQPVAPVEKTRRRHHLETGGLWQTAWCLATWSESSYWNSCVCRSCHWTLPNTKSQDSRL